MAIGYASVKVNITSFVVDGIDSDDLPDDAPLTAKLTLSPMIQPGRTLQYNDAGQMKLKAVAPIVVDIGATGDISHQGRDFVKVVAPTAVETNLARLQWRADFSDIRLGGALAAVKIDPIYFWVDPGAEINIADHVNVAASTAVSISRGARGFGIVGFETVDGDLVPLYESADGVIAGEPVSLAGIVSDAALASAVTDTGSATNAAVSAEVNSKVGTAVPPAVAAAIADDDTVALAAAAAVTTDIAGRDLVEGDDARLSKMSPATTGWEWTVKHGKWAALMVNTDGSVFIGRLDPETLSMLHTAIGPADALVRRVDPGLDYYPWRVKGAGSSRTPLAVRFDGAVDFSRLTPETLAYLADNLTLTAPETDAEPKGWADETNGTDLYGTWLDTGQRVLLDTGVTSAQVIDTDITWTKGGVRYFRHRPDEPNFLAADRTRVAWWGSSTMAGLSPDLTTLFTTLGVTTRHNGGIGGDRIEHILARMGARPYTLSAPLSVPTDTSAAAASLTVTPQSGSYGLGGHFEGFASIPGTLNMIGGSGFTFTRTTAGTATTIPAGTKYVANSSSFRDAAFHGLNIGKNSVPAGASAQTIFAATVEAYDYLRSLNKWVFVIGHFSNSNWAAGDYNDGVVKAYNALCADYFGERYIDLPGYVTGSQIWTDTGVTPTSGDLAQQAAGLKPTSLSNDDEHLNSVAYAAVVTHLIAPAITSKGWF